MKNKRSLDYDGLDGILQTSDTIPPKSVRYKSTWLYVMALLLISGYAFFPTPQSSKKTSTGALEAISTTQQNNIKISQQPLTPSTPPEITGLVETPPTPQPETGANATLSDPDTANSDQDSLNEPNPQQSPIDHPIEYNPASAAIDTQKADSAISPPVSSQPIDSLNDLKKTGAEPLFTVHFKFDSSKLKSLTSNEISDLLNAAKSCSKQIKLTGHTCSLGSDSSNSFLGLTRAKAVKKLLISLGIEPNRIVTTSEGMNQPTAPNDTKEGQALNRRTELTCLEY